MKISTSYLASSLQLLRPAGAISCSCLDGRNDTNTSFVTSLTKCLGLSDRLSLFFNDLFLLLTTEDVVVKILNPKW